MQHSFESVTINLREYPDLQQASAVVDRAIRMRKAPAHKVGVSSFPTLYNYSNYIFCMELLGVFFVLLVLACIVWAMSILCVAGKIPYSI